MAPSSSEEIAAQHAEALRMVTNTAEGEGGMACAPRQNLGEIPSSDKIKPTYVEATVKESTSTTTTTSASSSNGPSQEEKKDSNDGEEENNVSPPPLPRNLNEDHLLSLKNPICFSTRGSVDVSQLQDLVREGYNLEYNIQKDDKDSVPLLSPTNYWDPRNAKTNNVEIVRYSHDAWGIKKIVLIFCDDFMTKVYELPWWKDFQPALKPILDLLQLSDPTDTTTSNTMDGNKSPRRHLVRALLASLPPGVTIPVHHDSGEWVKWTHRIHVPVIVNDPSKILFRCGPTPSTMQRIDCIPGHVFEMNNQGKHAVSNCDSDSRVHLILDYVDVNDEHVINDMKESNINVPTSPRIVIQPGEEFVQTRRSIDRVKDSENHVPKIPHYIILGAQKAGTTSLYEYIIQHPWVAKARRRETHCLDWRWNDKLKTQQKQLEWCHKFFFVDELKHRFSCITGDSTPSYLLDSRRVIPRIQSVFIADDHHKSIKFFVMVRDPVKRALSHYAMVTSPIGTAEQIKTRGLEWREKTFAQVIELELEIMNKCGLIPYWNIKEGILDQQIFDTFVGSSQEDDAWDLYLQNHVPLNTGSYGLLTRGMYALQLRSWFRAFDRNQFCIISLESFMKKKDNNNTNSNENDDNHDDTPTPLQTIMKKYVWPHLNLPNHPVPDENAKNTREYQPMRADTQAYLQRFFEPHNRVFAKLMQQEMTKKNDNDSDTIKAVGDWDNLWPYTFEE